MTIGQRILQARTEAGLSQRQLAGEHMTRNMLSTLEHDKAKPSLETLVYLARMLNKPVGYFLGEVGPGRGVYEGMNQVREAFDRGDWFGCLELLAALPEENMIRRERDLLELLCLLEQTRRALEEHREVYARDLLQRAVAALEGCRYGREVLGRDLAVLRARAAIPGQERAAAALEIRVDEALLAKAAGALDQGRFSDARRYLEACDNRDGQWHYLMGETCFGQEDYAGAAEHYHAVEEIYGKPVWKKLELCYAQQKNFEMAYRYAVMQTTK